jgi:hypothetical protein
LVARHFRIKAVQLMGRGAEGPAYISSEIESIRQMDIVEDLQDKKVESLEDECATEDPPVAVASLESSGEEKHESGVLYDNPTYENGELQESNTIQESIGEPSGEPSGEPDKGDDGADRRRLYFIRMPKPPEQKAAPTALSQELEHLNMQIKLLDINLKMQRVRNL